MLGKSLPVEMGLFGFSFLSGEGTAGLPSSGLMMTRLDSAGLSLLCPMLVLGALDSEPERRPCLP